MFFCLLLLWLLLNGRVTVQVVLTGVVLCGALAWFAHHRLGVRLRYEHLFFRHLGRIVVYLAMLFCDIWASGLKVCRLILDPRSKISPRLFFIESHLRSPVSCTVMANSITITPGTIAHGLHGSVIYVHALDGRFEFGDLEKLHNVRLCRLEEEIREDHRA